MHTRCKYFLFMFCYFFFQICEIFFFKVGGATLLHSACYAGNTELARWLISKGGIFVHIYTIYGIYIISLCMLCWQLWTRTMVEFIFVISIYLLYIFEQNNLYNINFFFFLIAPINFQDWHGWTPLLSAISPGIYHTYTYKHI